MSLTKTEVETLTKCVHSFEHFLSMLGVEDSVVSAALSMPTTKTAHLKTQANELAIYAVWRLFARPDVLTLYVTESLKAVKEFRRQVTDIISQLPNLFTDMITTNNSTCISSCINSKMLLQVASRNAGRGLSVAVLLLDTPDTWNTKVKQEVYECLLPCIAASKQSQIISTF